MNKANAQFSYLLPLLCSALLDGGGIVGVVGGAAGDAEIATVGVATDGSTTAGPEDPASACGLSLTLDRDLVRRM